MIFLSVLLSAVPLALGGLLGAVALAWAAKAGISFAFLTLDRTPPDLLSILATGAVLFVGTALGVAWPALRASRIHPLEPARGGDPHRVSLLCLVAALAMAVGIALLEATGSDDPAWQAWLLGWLAIPATGLAALLASPWVVRLIGSRLSPPMARLTGSQPVLLADQISGDGPRSLGAVAAIGFGFAGFVTLLSWGMGLLELFFIHPGLPRHLVSVQPGGLDRSEVAAVQADPRFAAFQPLMQCDAWLGERERPWSARSEPVPALVLGIDAAQALGAARRHCRWSSTPATQPRRRAR